METLKARSSKKRPTSSVEAFCYYLQARREINNDNPNLAATLLGKAIEKDKKFAMAYWTLSKISIDLGKMDESVKWAQKAKTIDPDHPKWPYDKEKKKGEPVYELIRILREAPTKKINDGLNYKLIFSDDNELYAGVWTIDPGKYDISIKEQSSPKGNFIKDFLNNETDILAITGGPFESSQEKKYPSGLLIINGKRLKSITHSLSGILVIKKGDIDIIKTEEFDENEDYDYAIQSDPRLIEKNNQIGIRTNDYNRVNRCAACLSGNNIVIVFIASKNNTGLSLYEFARFLSIPKKDGGVGCDVALNLDGGVSAQLAFKYKKQQFYYNSIRKIQNAILVSEKVK